MLMCLANAHRKMLATQLLSHYSLLGKARGSSNPHSAGRGLVQLEYRTKLSPKEMAADAPFTGISLEGDPGDLANGPVKIKLFYEQGGEDRYAELFTNIDLAAHKLEVREKDDGYRSQVIRALRGN